MGRRIFVTGGMSARIAALSLLLVACGQVVLENDTGADGAGAPVATSSMASPDATLPEVSPTPPAAPVATSTGLLSTTEAPPSATAGQISAAPGDSRAGVPGASPTAIVKEKPPGLPPASVSGDLLAQAQQNGSVRIIVGLNVPFVLEGDLPDAAAVDAQHQAINDAQTALVQRLSAFTVRDIDMYESIPFVAMVVDAPALQALLTDPAVATIEEDRVSGPAAGPN